MREHALGVGEEVLIGGGIRLTVLAVGAGEVLLGVTAPDPSGAGRPEDGQRWPHMTTRPVLRASDN